LVLEGSFGWAPYLRTGVPGSLEPLGVSLCPRVLKTLVLGLGNPILRDDGVGIAVARAVRDRLTNNDVVVEEASVGGLRLLDWLAGFDRAVLIDAIQTADGKPGTVYHLDGSQFTACRHASSSHDADMATALEIGRRLGLPLPTEIEVIAVEATDVTTFGEDLTPAVASAIPNAVEAVLDSLQAK
jgi:hydrogenase maturation protease